MKSIRFVISALLIAAGAIFATAATAAPVASGLEWTAPTTRADGTPLAAAEIAGYRIYQSVDADLPTDPNSNYIAVTSGSTRTISIDLMPRAEPYVLRFGIRAVDTSGRISALGTASRTVRVASTAEPSAPTSVRIELNCEAGCVITVVE